MSSSPISQVPLVFRTSHPDPYSPQEVYIGLNKLSQYYSKEELKRAYMNNVLQLSDPPVEKQACSRKVYESIDKVKACYDDQDYTYYGDNALTDKIVIDGCFILGFLLEQKEKNEASIQYQDFGEKEENDLLTVSILKDLLLLENQIPFFVLKHLFELTILKSKPSASLTEHIKPLLEFGHRCLFTGHLRIPDDLADGMDHDHILGLLHKCYQPELACHVSSDTSKVRDAMKLKKTKLKILNAMELEKAGVSFRPNQDASWPMAIDIIYSRGFPWFWVKPTIIIPHLSIQERAEVLLRNMIAYEQTSKVDRYFTSFMSAIDDLVDTGHDVAKLVESRVVDNDLESNEEAANMINKICKNALKCNFYSKQWKELDAYYNRYTTVVRRTYFSNPWNSINLLAGVILFILSGVQTYFTINPA